MTLEQLFRGRSFDLEAAQARLTAMMAEQGLPYGKRTHTYNSRLAQELAKWAELQPGGETIHDALFRSYFVDGLNLARVDKLVEIAGSVGLSEERAQEVVENRSFAAAGIALVGMRKAGQRHRPANGKPGAAGRSPERLVVILLATAAVSSGLAVFSPGLGALVWVAFPVAAAVAGWRAEAVPEAADQ
jgi:protein-disulfide isomerase-like protein with CxxC motif